MSFFSRINVTERFGLVIDIGSGSALVAIVASKHGEEEPRILWSKREVASLREIENLSESSKSVMTALVNVLLEFETAGRQALQAYQPGGEISEVQCSVAAPWSYTMVKNINYKQDETFEISTELLEELVQTAKQKTNFELKEQKIVNDLGLSIVTEATLHVLVNGYTIDSPIGKTAKDISLVHTSVIIHTYLYETIQDLHKKMFPKAHLQIFSYALVLHCVANQITDAKDNLCLVDVTYEATEMGIIRGGIITYVTHTPYGLYSLAREISTITKLPLIESFKHLQTSDYTESLGELTAAKRADVETAIDAYIDRVGSLFTETGDDLAIPRQVVLHSDNQAVPFLTKVIEQAARRTIKSECVVTNATETILKGLKTEGKPIPEDTAMLVAAHFFHKADHCLVVDDK